MVWVNFISVFKDHRMEKHEIFGTSWELSFSRMSVKITTTVTLLRSIHFFFTGLAGIFGVYRSSWRFLCRNFCLPLSLSNILFPLVHIQVFPLFHSFNLLSFSMLCCCLSRSLSLAFFSSCLSSLIVGSMPIFRFLFPMDGHHGPRRAVIIFVSTLT